MQIINQDEYSANTALRKTIYRLPCFDYIKFMLW